MTPEQDCVIPRLMTDTKNPNTNTSVWGYQYQVVPLEHAHSDQRGHHRAVSLAEEPPCLSGKTREIETLSDTMAEQKQTIIT